MMVAENGDECHVGKAKKNIRVEGDGRRRQLGCCRVAVGEVARTSYEIFHHLASRLNWISFDYLCHSLIE